LEGEYEKAIVLYLDALKIFDQIGEKQLLANSYGNISIIYLRIKDYEKANAFNQKSSDINELLGNTSSYSLNILQKANILGDQNYYQQAIDVYKKGIELN
jgi:tetratricopeptide (TPR) repeat protein